MLFKHAEIFTPQGFVRGAFTVEDGRFGEILPQSPDMPGTDLGGARVIPGLIDIHNHGNSGADFSDGDPDGIRTMARYLAKNGVTSFAPASMSNSGFFGAGSTGASAGRSMPSMRPILNIAPAMIAPVEPADTTAPA